MSFPRYPEYKDSGVEWLGEVPAHWVVGPLRWYATIQGGVAKGKSYSDDTPTVDLPYLRVANVQDGHVDLSSVNTVTVALSEVDRYRLQTGDVLMNEGGDNDKLGRGTVWEGEIADCLHQNHVFAIRPNQYLLPYWLSMFTRSNAARSYFYLYSKQSTNLASISSSNVMSCPLPLPPQEEQRQVLSFLDHETARIDALVEEQQRLIKLLKEKRQTVISHAVTKGLDPDVPTKDSGVEWLGEVPAHWEKLLLKRVANIKYGIGEPPAYLDSGVPLIRATNVNRGEVTQNGMVFVEPNDIPEKRILWLKEGDIVVVRSGAYTGDSAIIRKKDLPSIAGFDMVVTPANCFPGFLQYALLSQYLKDNQIDLERLRAAQPHLNAEELGACFLLIPTFEEQKTITTFLDAETSKVDSMIEVAKKGIAYLTERRSALVSAAVTGKIDVRGWQPPAGSPAPAEPTQTEMV